MMVLMSASVLATMGVSWASVVAGREETVAGRPDAVVVAVVICWERIWRDQDVWYGVERWRRKKGMRDEPPW